MSGKGKCDLPRERVLKGLCPECGKEAAPYRLCYDCRQRRRITRALNRGAKFGALTKTGEGRNVLWGLGKNAHDNGTRKRWGSTPIVLPDTDRRGRPRLRGIRVDVDATLLAVVQQIGRPCSIEEIMAAWGRLRDRRTSPLAHDLAAIIKAADRRAAKNAKYATPKPGS